MSRAICPLLNDQLILDLSFTAVPPPPPPGVPEPATLALLGSALSAWRWCAAVGKADRNLPNGIRGRAAIP